MSTIEIFYAYDGLLYAPIFVANELGLFPKKTVLTPTNSDEAAIGQVCENMQPETRTVIAVCDPFAGMIDKAAPRLKDDLCVIASLINVLPLWVFNSDPKIQRVKNEEELSQYRRDVKELITYKEGTTGYVIGQRLKDKFGPPSLRTETVEFGAEFQPTLQKSSVVLTADVLRIMLAGPNNHNVVFPYATKGSDDLDPYLFTGILTLRKTIKSNLWAVLAVLGAIQSVMDYFTKDRIKPLPDECTGALAKRFASSLDLYQVPVDKRVGLIRESVEYLANNDVYAKFPKPVDGKEWVKSWNNAKAAWLEQYPERSYPNVDESIEGTIPSLLVRNSWNEALSQYYAGGFGRSAALAASKGSSVERLPSLPVWQTALLLLGTILLISSVFAMIQFGKYAFYVPESDSHKIETPLFLLFAALFAGEAGTYTWMFLVMIGRAKGEKNVTRDAVLLWTVIAGIVTTISYQAYLLPW